MGLDMYLKREVYLGWNYEHNRKMRGEATIKVPGIDQDKISTVTESFGYWRKANQIHNWFITHSAKGEDDCRPVWVSREQFEQLLETVNEVIANHNKAEKLLPTASGFFFGNTEYDEWYFQELKDTKELIEKVLKQMDEDDKSKISASWYYEASW